MCDAANYVNEISGEAKIAGSFQSRCIVDLSSGRLAPIEASPMKKRQQQARRRPASSDFGAEFTRIVTEHLSKMSPEEQDKRIRSALQVSSAPRRAAATKRRASETRRIRRVSLIHEAS